MKLTVFKFQKRTLLLFSIVFLFSTLTFAQGFNLSSDLVSRYVWRGIDFGQSASVQPTLSFSTNNFEIGFWGAYQLGRDASVLPADEIDLYLGYSFDIGKTSLSLIVTDYYFPNGVNKLGSFEGDGNGAHTIEVGATFSVPELLPLYISGFINVHNEVDNSIYLEIGYSTIVKEINLDVFIGATPGGENAFYNTTTFSLLNVGIKTSKEIKITNNFSLPVFGSLVVNPNEGVAHLIFGISI